MPPTDSDPQRSRTATGRSVLLGIGTVAVVLGFGVVSSKAIAEYHAIKERQALRRQFEQVSDADVVIRDRQTGECLMWE